MWSIRLLMPASVVILVVTATALARSPNARGDSSFATETPPVTATPATPSPAESATATLETPPTPGPDTPTPALPEEGGPTGGVISGHLYYDLDGSRTYTPGDTGVQGSGVTVFRLGEGDALLEGYGAVADATGRWEIRALPDGRYRVIWEPPVSDADLARTIPPAQELIFTPIETITVVTTIVEIRGANRVTGVDFGIPRPTPAVGGAPPSTPVRLPDTGDGSSLGTGHAWAIAAGALLALGASAALALRRKPR